MYGLAEHELLPQRNGEDGLEGATERPSKRVREERRTRHYVVRDLSWELARYFDVRRGGLLGKWLRDTKYRERKLDHN
jgi:hypothetical protein